MTEVPHLTEPHTSENILTVVTQCQDELPPGVVVRGLITDNEEKMRTLRDRFESKERAKGNFVSCPGDPLHAIQLVICETLKLPQFEKIVSDANFVSMTFKNTRCKQFLKTAKQLGKGDRLGVCNLILPYAVGDHACHYPMGYTSSAISKNS